MPTKLQFYSALAEQSINDLTSKRGNWTRFLDSASWLYKYPFQDQLMIHAQRPDATACAELELWNEKFDRWVRRGSKGIALIDDSGSYPRLKYVFDVSDTESSLYRARPVQLWEMRGEHKAAVMAEITKNYEDVSADDSLADTFRNIAKQLAREYYEDNYREIYFRAENSALEPSVAYDFAGTPIEQGDDSILRAMFEEMLANSIAYTVMARCGLDPGEYFEEEDFQGVIDFNTPDMVNALGVATSELSEQVLRDIELTIRKYERTHTAERSENNYDRNPKLHAGRGLSTPQHQTERTAEGTDGTARQVRQNEESVPQRTQGDNVQPPAAHGEIVSAPAGSGRSGDSAAHADDGRTDGTEQPARQGERPDGLDGGDERSESAGRGNSPERIDLRIEQPARGAAEQAAPFSMAELAQYHTEWNNYIKNSVLSDGAVLNAAVNMDKKTTIYEIVNSIKFFHAKLNRSILDSTEIRKGDLWRELDNYISKDRTPPLADQLYDAVIQSDAYKERLAKNETSSEQETPVADGVSSAVESAPRTYSQLGNRSIQELLSGSAVSLAEVDAILRDGGNFDSSAYNTIPFNSRSTLRIAARFTKGKEPHELTDYLRYEYLRGRHNHPENPTGKGFDFGNHRVCAWYDESGIQLAIGVTAKNNIHRVTIPWEDAAARINELMLGGQYVSREAFTNALENELNELANRLWDFYRDDMHDIPEEWNSHEGHPGDVAIIKSLLDNDDERQAILNRLEIDVDTWNNDPESRSWHSPNRLLADMREAMLPPAILPDDSYNPVKTFSYFITQDEIDALLTHGGTYSEGKFRFLSFFLGDHDEKEKLEFIKREYGHGGGTWSDTDGWHNAEPGKGLSLQRGRMGNPDAEVNLKWNAVIKRTEQLIANGQYMTRAELDYLPRYERLMLVRKVNMFFYDLPAEYERPFTGKYGFSYNEYRDENGEKTLDFTYPREAEWQAIRDLLDNPEHVDALLAQMQYIYENTSTEDRYYSTRKSGYEALAAYSNGIYTLFPGLENLPDPETAAARRIAPPVTPRREMVEDMREPSSRGFFADESQTSEQMTLFDVGLPVLPSADEQRLKIDQKLQQKTEQTVEAEAKAPALSLPADADEPFLNISDEDKARIAAQFADNPRSREAVNLVREIYGDTLGMPLPQAVKRITELAADGRFTTAAERITDAIEEIAVSASEKRMSLYENYQQIKSTQPDSMILLEVGSFYEMFGKDAEIASELLGLEIVYRDAPFTERTPMCGFPAWVLDYNIEQLIEAGYKIAVVNALADGERKITVKEPEAAQDIETETAEQHSTNETVRELITGYAVSDELIAFAIDELTADGIENPTAQQIAERVESVLAADADEPSAMPVSTEETIYFTKGNNIPYRVGSTVDVPAWHGTRATIQIDLVDDNLVHYTILDDNHEKESGKIERERFEGFIDSKRYNIINDELEPEKDAPAPFDFDTVAQTVLERVMADTDYAETLASAKTRASLRNPCTWALEQSIRDHEADEPEVYRRYFSDDDFNDNLFDYVLRQSWANKPIPQASVEEPTEPQPVKDLSTSETAAEPPVSGTSTEQMPPKKPTVPPPVFFVDWNAAQHDFDMTLYKDRDIIGYDKDGVEHKLGRSGSFNYVTQTGAFWGSNEVPGNIYEQIQAYKNGEVTPEQVRENYLKVLEAFKGSRAAETIEPTVPEAVTQTLHDGFTEITDPAELAEIEAIFGKSQASYIVGQRVVLDLRSKHTGLIGEFHVDAINGDNVTVKKDGFTENITAAEVERFTIKPVAEKLYEELSPSGRNTTAYYLFQYPGGIDAGAVLDYETLALVKDRADTYIICAEACHLSENDLKKYNIGFRKMPRDWNMLPDTAKEQIRAFRPEYERQWQELYGEPEQTTPRYIIKPVTRVEQISSNPRVVDLIGKGEQSTFHGIYDTQAERYLMTDDDRYIYFPTEKEALAYIEKLNAGIEVGTQNASAPRPATANFRITDDHLGEGGAKTKFRNNLKALQTLNDIEFENRSATPEEQEILSRYVGWGGIQEAFDPKNKAWENEYFELKALLTPEEWESARSTTLYAHYTSPLVIKAIYETIERMGFKSGNILEPACGIGNFFGLLPDSMRDSKLYGVEIDSVTARIAKQLYPKADIQHTGFEKTQFSDSFFDVAIGNVPFGGFGVIDKRYKTNFQIHDYFFQKTLDKVRPGGIVAFITSKGTLDKKNPEARKYLAQRAELLGAVRLPNNTFLKNAGTEVTTDILFFQKRDRPLDIEPEWVHLGLTEDELPVNRYFLDNPEMMLGTMTNGAGTRMYGNENSTTCIPIEGADLAEQLKTALSYIQGEYAVDELDDLDGVDDHAIPADTHVKNFSYALITPTTEPDNADGKIYAAKIGEGQVYFRENSLMYPVDLPAMTLERIKGMIGLRECVQRLITLQLDDYSDAEIKEQQDELNTLYDGFIAEFGLISSTANSRAFNADSSYYLLSALEIINEDGELERKADMFTKRTVKQRTVITHVDTASEALAVSIGEKARVDLDYMSELTGFSREKLLDDLQGVVFLNIGSADSQEKAYVTADEYLSGNVRKKLELARAAAIAAPELEVNVRALEAIQPKDLEAGEIAVRLGATWIDPKYVQQFMYEMLNTSWRNKDIYQVKYHQYTGEWQVTGKGKSQFSDIPATVTYGTGRMNAYQIIDDTLNLRDVRVYDYKEDADGKERRVLNKKETMLAQQKQEIIKKKFQDWIWQEPERRQTLVHQYNEMFNSIRTREYDGSHITFDGMNPEIKMGKHQVDGAARHLYGGNALYAHVVGAGKTFTMIAAAMESKRLGLCQKSLFAVPNHLTEQWATEFLRLYPSANILVATKKDFEMRNRKKFCAKIATGDYDAVIIGHTQLEKIPMSRERQERQVREQIWEIEQGIRELKDTNGERFSIKQLEKTKRGLENRLAKLLDSKRRDDVVTFEQLGVDRLYVDEAHSFKNLFLYTKMRNVAGLSTSEAQKSSDLFMKCRYMDELTDNKGVIFATGTPISNSMSEMYTMQRYLQFDTLTAKRLTHFDSWASIFGETVTSIELAPEGTGYRARTRFAKFHNLPELMCLFKQVADIQTADMLNLPVPEAKYENIIVEPSDIQQDMVQELSERAAAVHAREVPPQVDNMLKITTDGRKIGLDQRLMNPLLPDHEGSKVNACTDNVFRIWNDTRADRLTQLVFCDFSTPNKDGRFNVYDDIRAKLLERGIPESEIAFIHDADTEVRKKELFAKVRQGKVRVLFGSTFKMGAGTNVQDKLIAIHDADCPWRPADLEQRAGRIIRQGNKNAEVFVYRYATSGTFDSYLWQTVQKKQEFIAQIMSSKSPVRSCEDVDETALSYAEIKALCAGNPLIAEKMNLDNEVAKLRMLKAEHKSQHYRLEDDLLKRFPEQIASVTERIAGIEKDIVKYAAEKEKCSSITMTSGAASVESKFPGMTINGVVHHEKEPAAKALLEACKGVKGRNTDVPVGEYMGFKLSLRYESFGQQINLLMRGAMTYQIELGTDTFGNITRINNALDDLPKRLDGAKSNLENLDKQVEAAKVELAKPFEQESELDEKEARLALLNADLNIDGNGDMDVLNDTESREAADEYSEDEPDDNYDEDEPDDEEYSGNYRYGSERVAQVATAKTKPSILDGIRNFDSGKHSGAPGSTKSAELDI